MTIETRLPAGVTQDEAREACVAALWGLRKAATMNAPTPVRLHNHRHASVPHPVLDRHFGPAWWAHCTEIRAWRKRKVRGPGW